MAQPEGHDPAALWLGSYTADGGGTGRGIYRVPVVGIELGEPVLAAEASSPSFLATHPRLPVLYAVEEFTGRIQAYAVTDAGALEPLGPAWPAGDTVCHVAVDPSGQHVVAACYGSGAVVDFGLDETGAIRSRREAEPARDPHAGGRAGGLSGGGLPGVSGNRSPRASRAHMTLMLPGARALTTDLGFDLVRLWRFDAERGLIPDQEVVLPEGTGPRHAVRHPSGHVYVVTEFTTVVHVLHEDAAGRFSHSDTFPVLGERGAASGAAPVMPAGAHITLNQGGTRAHVSVRGTNCVATLAIRPDGAQLIPLADDDCGGDWPRHHVELGDRIVVANQRSASLATLRVGSDGRVREVMSVIPAPTPACLVPAW